VIWCSNGRWAEKAASDSRAGSRTLSWRIGTAAGPAGSGAVGCASTHLGAAHEESSPDSNSEEADSHEHQTGASAPGGSRPSPTCPSTPGCTARRRRPRPCSGPGRERHATPPAPGFRRGCAGSQDCGDSAHSRRGMAVRARGRKGPHTPGGGASQRRRPRVCGSPPGSRLDIFVSPPRALIGYACGSEFRRRQLPASVGSRWCPKWWAN